jgi:hypothetical protein
MPRTETVLQALVASPSDVSDERALLEEIVRELNLTWSKTFGLRVELIKWETHAYPDIGNTPQEVINKQIGNEFDIFIGIMWGKFGTPTGKFGSGTENEFQNAYKIYQSGERKLWIMCYFKDAGIPPSEIDLAQLQSVNAFRSKLGDEGVLRWKFRSKDEFAQLTRLHLSRVVQEWINEKGSLARTERKPITQSSPSENKPDNQPELGYLDYLETSQDSGQKLLEVIGRIVSYMNDLTAKANSKTAELDKIRLMQNNPQKFQMVRRNIDFVAQDIEEFSKRLDLELPFFKMHFESVINSLTNIAVLENQFSQQPKESVQGAVNGANILVNTLKESKQAIEFFRQSMAELPNMSARLNASKRQVLSVIDRFLVTHDSSIRLTIEAESVLRSLISK